MSSTVQGSLGGSNAGAIVTAFTLLNGVPTVVATSDVAAATTGNFSLGGLAAGVYLIIANLNNGQLGNVRASNVTNVLTVNTIAVDGSTTYHL